MKSILQIVLHHDMDSKVASEVLKKFGEDLMSAIDSQIIARRPPCVVFTHISEQESLLIYAGDRTFARLQRIPLSNKKASYYAVVMPLHCKEAAVIQNWVRNDPRSQRFELEPSLS